MKNTLKLAVVLIAMCISAPSFSQTPAEALSACMTDHLTGKDSKNLAKWIYFSIASYPDLTAYASVTAKDIRASDEFMGALVTRLITVDCTALVGPAYKSDPLALQNAFAALGRVAMQALMTNPDVQKSIAGYIQYTDVKKVNQLLTPK